MTGIAVRKNPRQFFGKSSMSPNHYIYLFAATSALIDIVAGLVFVFSPYSGTVRGYFLNEDSLIENLTAGVYFCTFLLALNFLVTRRITSNVYRKWLILVFTLGIVGFLDEISFGERLFDLEMPVLAGTKIDALHDFFGLGVSLMDRLISQHLLIAVLLLLTGLVIFSIAILKYGKRFWHVATVDGSYPVFLIIFIFTVLVLSALILDANLLPVRGDRALEEMFELNASMALLTSCFIIDRLDANKRST